MKILVLNCGSSSIKYKLYDMADESVLAQGIVERIGLDEAFIKVKLDNGEKKQIMADLPTIIKFHLDECLIKSDTLNTTLSQYRLICHIVQFVLNGTTTAV